MKHQESELQIQCVRWFRTQYPAYACLLEHPKNEGGHGHTQGAIAKAEGVQAGVADLILHVPAYYEYPGTIVMIYHSLAVEMKTKTGRQRSSQKRWQRYFEAAGGKYLVIRSFDDFKKEVTQYMGNVPDSISTAVHDTHLAISQEEDQEAKEQFKKLIGKK